MPRPHFSPRRCSADPDRARAERLKLKRAVAREARGAARELRKDNRFLQQEREKERDAAGAEREAKYKEAVQWLQKQEQDARSGGQGGGQLWKKRKRS